MAPSKNQNQNQNSNSTTNASNISLPSRPKREEESPVSDQSDQDTVETPADEIVADYDLKLGKEERDAIDTSNILSERTRHAKPVGTYILPDDDDDDEGDEVLLRADGTVIPADADMNEETLG
ncbi:hypothetical protein F5Y11DRAFT_322395 [Daldinia sp. FL1419]|nr:hypothetical protein F5Y11DRAFT_322395 [Daldinia sp. FL1419]